MSSVLTAAFRFGNNDVHELRMECSWFGAERYYLDEVLVFKHWSFKPSGNREFMAAGHRIRICIQAGLKQVASQAYVDGELKAEDLFSDFNRRLRHRRPWWVNLMTWLAIALASAVVTVLVSK